MCNYQAIDYAIPQCLKQVEAGAQGAHKLARGYRPTPTLSAHYIVHPDFRRAIADYLEAERNAVANHISALDEMTPFRQPGCRAFRPPSSSPRRPSRRVQGAGPPRHARRPRRLPRTRGDRESVVWGKSVLVSVDTGGCRLNKKKI